MIRYTPHLKGSNTYSECMDRSLCEGAGCTKPAEFTLNGEQWDSEPTHLCQEHLQHTEFDLQGRCDGCNKHSFDPWLCLVLLNTRNLHKLCKKCHREKRRVKC